MHATLPTGSKQLLFIVAVRDFLLRLALGTDALKDSLVTIDHEAGLLLGNLASDNGTGNVYIVQAPTLMTMNVVVPVDPSVESACLVSKREFLDETAFGKQMQRPVDGAVGHTRISFPDTLVDLACGHVTA